VPDNNQKQAPIDILLSNLAKSLKLENKTPIDATAWFLGPKAENHQALQKLVTMAVKSQVDTRQKYMPNDPEFTSDVDEKSIEIIEDALTDLLDHLRSSIPLASYRNQSHMYWDLTLPGTVGYFAAMLYNQNNVAAEASPVTTLLEIQVGKDLCYMLGFNTKADKCEQPIVSWGHITCDGSVANGESMWAARNLKYLPVALAAAIAIEPDLEAAKIVTVPTCEGGRGRLIDLSVWQLLNLPIDNVIQLPVSIAKQSGVEEAIVHRMIDKYSVQNIGLVKFQQRFLETYEQATPVVLVPATAHYSWPKTAALIGLGTHSVQPVEVDLDGRMNMSVLRRELDNCLRVGRPVIQVVAVMGSTAEGSVDPLADIVKIREEYQAMGLNFVIHVDGAWGGYFTSILRDSTRPPSNDLADIIDRYPQLYTSDYFKTHFANLPFVDSITLDPHKSGFIPYPAGSLCYRNGAMRDLITYTSPVVSHGSVDPTVGPYGIEGSKPGAAAASVYLSNKVIPLDKTGYGRILGRCLFNSKRFYAALMSMDLSSGKSNHKQFNITAFQRLPAEKTHAHDDEILEQKRYLKEHIVPYPTDELINDVLGLPNLADDKQTEAQKKAYKIFTALGSDLSIISYAFNFKTADGQMNTSVDLMNDFNNLIFRALSLQPTESKKIPSVEMFITSAAFDPAVYGQSVVDDFVQRSGAIPEDGKAVNFLISTTQNPWLSTTTGKEPNMIDTLIDVLTRKVNEIASEFHSNCQL